MGSRVSLDPNGAEPKHRCQTRESRKNQKMITDDINNQKLKSIDLNAWFGSKQALKEINLTVKANAVTAIIGPSGCGKSTFIRCLNRMHELVPNARMSGQVLLDGKDIYSSEIDPVQIRRRVGMVFQK